MTGVTTMMAPTQSRLIELSTSISKNTATLDRYLKDNNLPQPSFDNHEPTWDKDFPGEIQQARIAIQDATLELSELTLGSRKLLSQAVNHGVTNMDTIHSFDIPHKIPIDEPNGITYSELCQRLQKPVNEYALTRILRAAIVNRIFREPSPGRIAHSAASRLLATDDLLFDWLGSGVDVLLPQKYIGKAMQKFPEMDEANRSAASLAFPSKQEGEYLSFYQYVGQDPERAKMFGRGMSSFQKGDGYAAKHVVDGFDWASLPSGSTVVDVGGSHGDIDMAIARKFPGLKFVVQDLPETIASAEAARKVIKDERLSIEFMVHDFLTPQTEIQGVKVFILRWILHNWPDKYCVKILRALVPAMEKGSKVLVVDAVMPDLGTLANAVERDLRFSDMTMLSCFNAGDREVGRYRDLLEEAGLRFAGVTKPEGSRLSIIEGVWQG